MAKKVLLLLARGFEEYEASVFTDVFGWSRAEGLEGVELVTAGLRKMIRGTWSLVVELQSLVQDLDPDSFDALAIPGGFEEAGYYEDAYDEAFLNVIRHFNDAGKPVATICVGALPVARAGALRNRKATTYDLGGGHRRKQLAAMGAVVTDERIVRDRNIITSTGPATAPEVAFTLLEILTSPENARQVKHRMRFLDL
jgi:4-methyl-5(b-hydroxyethyl)-thiazole monophosphate biosynthesis